MADSFDGFLAAALAPPERAPDRAFVAGVQARIAFEQRLGAQRRAVTRRLAAELWAVAVIAAALIILGRSDAIAGFAAQSPAPALAILLSMFALTIVGFGATLGVRSRSSAAG